MVTKPGRTGSKAAFFDRYKPDEGYLLKPQTAQGRPGLLEAIGPNGDAVLVRVWPRRTKGDNDLVDIWKHELRQLHRLGGYPGAEKYIARIIDAEQDAKGFYIVLDAGQRRPLQIILDRGRTAAEWLRALNQPANRHRLWRNFQRVARGLEILHNEGMVHRNLDAWSILTTAGDDPDFQLTGFEWSLRISSTGDRSIPTRGAAAPTVSFASDWADFARLAARIFNINDQRLANMDLPDYEVHESATAGEIRLLRDLLFNGNRTRADGESVSARIDQLLEALDAAKASDDGRYHLVLRLTQESGLSVAVREASGLKIDSDDAEGQLAWIEADIGEIFHLVAAGDEDQPQFYVRGRELVYRLKQYRAGEELTWQFAFCESAETATAWSRRVLASRDLPATSLRLFPLNAARLTFQRVRGRVPSWTRQIDALIRPSDASMSREAKVHRALTLLHALEIAFAASNAFPVQVRSTTDEDGTVELEYAKTADADELSDGLGLTPPLQRLQDALESEKNDSEGWILTESSKLGQAQSGDVEITFDETIKSSDRARFLFRQTSASPTLMQQGFLVPAGARGTFFQIRRRSKAIKALKDHLELLQVLAEPRRRLISTHEDVDEDPIFQELDQAKQIALKELTGILPLYLLQGPPGVGKTFLVKDVIRRQFLSDKSTRLLISAQGNHAIDHVLDELSEAWSEGPDDAPLVVRCRAKDDNTAAGPFDLLPKTEEFAANLGRTALAKEASATLKGRLDSLSSTGTAPTGYASGEKRSLEGLVMRAANLVFATTNSADLERLVEERGQFDWTIIEEAGKATGCELVAPMMLSHRRLMIGDHKQLPPFGALDMEELLSNVGSVRRALKALPKAIHGTARNLLDEDLLEFIEDDSQDLESLCTEAKRVLFMFETAIEQELERKDKRPGGRSIASTLSVQHRMHPDICELVSKTFYNGTLTTSSKREVDARTREGEIGSLDTSRLPAKPVVFVDMPYERSETGRGRIERHPRFINEEEVDKVIDLLSCLTTSDGLSKKPSLVILAPYMRQVRRIKEAIGNSAPAMSALEKFRPVARGGEWCSTVDSFQGNEADVVIISLVRNNRGATIRRALGFMADRRRFNVAISRAKQKLIFVGSLAFLRTIAAPLGLENDPSSDFLRAFLATADTQIKEGRAVKINATGGAAK